MAKDFRLPDLGEGVHEGQIIKLLVDAGDPVTEDQPLMEVETDKAAVEIPSPHTGIVQRWHVEENQVVNVGDVMVTFADAGEVIDSSTTAAAAPKAAAVAVAATSATTTAPARSAVAGRRRPASPAVRKRARMLGLDIEIIPGSGPGGRITRADIERAANGAPATAAPTTTVIAPSSPALAPVTATVEPPGTDDADAWGPTRRQPLSQARKTIANVMTQSWTTIPHVTDSDDADVTDLDRLRRGYPSPENGNRKITMLAFLIRAVARALRMHPIFNAHFDEATQEIVYRRYVGIAVGVHTERGLIAPVIRDTDTLSVAGIADALDALTQKARTATFAVNDTRGGTYTISNAGAFGGSHYSTPIVTPGQCAVLAVGRSRQMPWVVDGQIVPRLIMPLSHSFDHRIADGGEEIAFLRCIIDALENPARLLL